MKCHFTFDPISGKKILLPMCYGSLHQEDLSHCTCADIILTENQFFKEIYNTKVKELNKEITDLREFVNTLKKDNYALMRIIEKLTKSKLK